MDRDTFRYQPTCSAKGCDRPAIYKVAAAWSSSKSRELKNYGLSCDAHRESQLARARAQRAMLKTAEGESVGDIALYRLVPGKRDIELLRVDA
jgi:hypothetical protein